MPWPRHECEDCGATWESPREPEGRVLCRICKEADNERRKDEIRPVLERRLAGMHGGRQK